MKNNFNSRTGDDAVHTIVPFVRTSLVDLCGINIVKYHSKPITHQRQQQSKGNYTPKANNNPKATYTPKTSTIHSPTAPVPSFSSSVLSVEWTLLSRKIYECQQHYKRIISHKCYHHLRLLQGKIVALWNIECRIVERPLGCPVQIWPFSWRVVQTSNGSFFWLFGLFGWL